MNISEMYWESNKLSFYLLPIKDQKKGEGGAGGMDEGGREVDRYTNESWAKS